MTKTLARHLDFYVEFGRPATGSKGVSITSDESPLSLMSKGRAVTKVSHVTNKTWQSMGLPGTCTPTVIRKTAATKAVQSLAPQEADGVAQLMEHDPSTQKDYYVAAQTMREKLVAWRQLSDAIALDNPSNKMVTESSCDGSNQQQSISSAQDPIQEPMKEMTTNAKTCQLPPATDNSKEDPNTCQTLSQQPPTTNNFKACQFYSVATTYKQGPASKYSPQLIQKMTEMYHEYERLNPNCKFMHAARYLKKHMPDKMLDQFSVKQVADKLRHDQNTLPGLNKNTANERCLSTISISSVKFILHKHMSFFKDIVNEKISFASHKTYKKGPFHRAKMLPPQFGTLSEGNYEATFTELFDEFGNEDTAMIDYITKVLMPEAFIIIAMDHLGVQRSTAQQIVSNTL